MLTIEPGATLLFEVGGNLIVGQSAIGGIVARGLPAAPIRFTSVAAVPVAGDWDGIWIGAGCIDADSDFENVIIEYGGGNTYANLYFGSCDARVADSLVQHSSTYGIYRSNSTPTLSNVTYASNASGDLL